MDHVTSRDGTLIAYERAGSGPALILVDGALCSRAFGPSPKLSAQLASHFTVYSYDRRGRGDSGDTQPYAPQREIEDLAALVQAAGGTATLLGLSSGAALALEAAASGLTVDGVVAYEPPYVDEGLPGVADDEAHLRALLAAGKRSAAVRYFMREMVGAPGIVVAVMRLMPKVWPKLKAVAHTLPYDAAVMSKFRVPAERLASIRVPTLVAHGGKTDPRLKRAARAVREAVPGAEQRVVAGQTHNVSAEALTPVVLEFCHVASRGAVMAEAAE
jgi:pimeloyl-ACP methyl ester carboxylesterase